MFFDSDFFLLFASFLINFCHIIAGMVMPGEQLTKLENDLHFLLALSISENSITALKVGILY